MKRIITLLASMALVAAGLQIVPAMAAAPAPTEVKFFLGSTGCSAEDVNFDFLTTTDADAEVECNYTAAGLRYEIGNQTGTVEVPTPAGTQRPLSSREDATRYFDSIDGGPIVLDASKPVTGQIFTAGAACAVGGVPCSPVTLSGGEVILDITLVGKSGEEEVELGAQTATFNAQPGDPVKTDVSIQPDAALTGKTFETIELRTWVHGKSGGHGVIKTNGDHSSFISVPTATAGNSGKTPPGKNPIPGKKKGCDKGKGKKRGCEGKGKKSPKPGKPSAQCAPFSPGEAGAEAKTIVVTDAAAEDKPVEEVLTFGEAIPFESTSTNYVNIQVDSAGKEVGLYAYIDFMPRNDYDLNLLHPDGSYAAQSHGFNPLIEINDVPLPVIGPFSSTGHGGESTDHSERLVGIKTADCGGWTLDVTNFAGPGGDVPLQLWLGEAKTEPSAEGEVLP